MDNKKYLNIIGNKKHLWIIIAAVLLAAGTVGGYFYFSKEFPSERFVAREAQERGIVIKGDHFTLRIYYPLLSRLQMEERIVKKIPSQSGIAEAVVEEFLKGPANTKGSVVPPDGKLLGLYKGSDGVLYVDLSDDFRRNFNGDVIAEFMLLRGLYESLMSNVQDINDVKLLIEGREMESLGGHIYTLYPLKDTVSSEQPDFSGQRQ